MRDEKATNFRKTKHLTSFCGSSNPVLHRLSHCDPKCAILNQEQFKNDGVRFVEKLPDLVLGQLKPERLYVWPIEGMEKIGTHRSNIYEHAFP
jgi:hypothetical protein